MNIKGGPAETAAKVTALGFPVTVQQMDQLAGTIGEKTLFGRTGGAATLAVGMAGGFYKTGGGGGVGLLDHFWIIFEALFIFTTPGARPPVGRVLLVGGLWDFWKTLGARKKTK